MTKRITLNITEQMDEEIEELVNKGVFSTKTAVIEEALRMLFIKYSDFAYDTLRDHILQRLTHRK